jgi:hypothetical protein
MNTKFAATVIAVIFSIPLFPFLVRTTGHTTRADAPVVIPPPGVLVWSDEFSNNTGANAQPDATIWTYDTRQQRLWE